jgi:molybdopterin converting factor small subunit
LDLIVRTPEDLRWRLEEGDWFMREVMSKGTVLYEIEAMFEAHPGIRDRVPTERGEIREHVNVFVRKNEARSTGGLATPLADSTEISVIPAISGG